MRRDETERDTQMRATQRLGAGWLAAGLVLFGCATAQAAPASLVSVASPRGAKVSFILIKPDKPVASVVLFAGGHGGLGLKSANDMTWGRGNFLVRMRDAFADRGLMVAVIDAPSDHKGGMNAIFRMSGANAQDIDAVAAYLKKENPVPVWVVGTSMGTFSAAAGAIGARAVDGLVLTSTITRAKPQWKIAGSHPDGVASMPLQKVTVPTFILSHRHDGCDITPASDIPKLAKRLTAARKVESALLDGGSPPRSEPCEAMSQHGFIGIEQQAVSKIADFVKQNAK
jgi:dienelactone hydrolase